MKDQLRLLRDWRQLKKSIANKMCIRDRLQTCEITGDSTWNGNQYVDFHLEFYILFRFSHGKELL